MDDSNRTFLCYDGIRVRAPCAYDILNDQLRERGFVDHMEDETFNRKSLINDFLYVFFSCLYWGLVLVLLDLLGLIRRGMFWSLRKMDKVRFLLVMSIIASNTVFYPICSICTEEETYTPQKLMSRLERFLNVLALVSFHPFLMSRLRAGAFCLVGIFNIVCIMSYAMAPAFVKDAQLVQAVYLSLPHWHTLVLLGNHLRKELGYPLTTRGPEWLLVNSFVTYIMMHGCRFQSQPLLK